MLVFLGFTGNFFSRVSFNLITFFISIVTVVFESARMIDVCIKLSHCLVHHVTRKVSCDYLEYYM